jgi:membrane-associated phospholipid phosphatase
MTAPSASSSIVSSRRAFLGLGSVASISLFAGGLAAGASSAPGLFAPRNFSKTRIARRQQAAFDLRHRAALAQSRVRVAAPVVNGDETRFTDALGSYSKGMPHDAEGIVDPEAWNVFIRALETGDSADFELIPKGGTAKQANPQAAFAYDLAGADGHALSMPAPPAFSSAETAGEMVELYGHALLRDLPFDSYGSDPGVVPVLAALNALSDFRGPKSGGAVTAGTLFRGVTPGDLAGNYVSQFLLLPVPYGAQTIHQNYKVPMEGDDHMTDATAWLNILRGGAPATVLSYDSTPRYLATARDLGEYVHRDYSYQAFLNAALILLGMGAPLRPGNPYKASLNQGGFVTFGAPEILSRVADVSQSALKAAWFQKWLVHRRLRPEVYAGRVHQVLGNGAGHPLHSDVIESPLTAAVREKTGTWFLPMAFPEGSPTHPAYPAGHAVIAGACVTVLKAFFDGNHILPAPVLVDPTSNGTAVLPLAATLTVEGELNKLANNIAIGRNLAGVHWRSDGQEGLLLGQAVAVAALKDWKRTYHQDPGVVDFKGFGGESVTI